MFPGDYWDLLFTQAKAYARANGIPTGEKLDTDRSIIGPPCTISNYDYCYDQSANSSPLIDPSLTGLLFICIFTMSNVFMLNLALLNFRKIFLALQRQGKQAKILYKATAIVLTFVNIITLISDISISVKNFEVIVLVWSVLFIKIPLTVLMLVLELLAAYFSTPILNDATLKRRNVWCQRFSHAFAMCQITWFVHRLVNDTLISIVFFVIAPAQTLGIDTLLLATIGSGIAFVAIIIRRGFHGCNKFFFSFMFCTILNGITMCGLLFVITLVFIIFVDNGLKSAGMGGLILSLIPPLAVTVIGYIIKEKYFNSTSSKSEAEDGLQEVNGTIQNDVDDAEQDPQETTPLLHSQC